MYVEIEKLRELGHFNYTKPRLAPYQLTHENCCTLLLNKHKTTVSTFARGKAESAHEKQETSSFIQLSSILAVFRRFLTCHHFDVPFSVTVNAHARKCEFT